MQEAHSAQILPGAAVFVSVPHSGEAGGWAGGGWQEAAEGGTRVPGTLSLLALTLSLLALLVQKCKY